MMHPAKALETAVFTLAAVRNADSVNIRNTDIVVGIKSGLYWVNDAGKEYRHLGRHAAIDLLEQLLVK